MNLVEAFLEKVPKELEAELRLGSRGADVLFLVLAEGHSVSQRIQLRELCDEVENGRVLAELLVEPLLETPLTKTDPLLFELSDILGLSLAYSLRIELDDGGGDYMQLIAYKPLLQPLLLQHEVRLGRGGEELASFIASRRRTSSSNPHSKKNRERKRTQRRRFAPSPESSRSDDGGRLGLSSARRRR